jgi:hypothetical protein
MTYEDITKELREGNPSPGQLSDFQLQLSGEFGFISSRLEEILKAKPSIWLDLREKSKSDAQADKKWEASERGIEETIYQLKLKAISKQMSAINSRLHIANMEARSQY